MRSRFADVVGSVTQFSLLGAELFSVRRQFCGILENEMKMSSKARYGVYVAVELAKRYGEVDPVPVCVLAQATGVTEKYLEQIVALLKKDGLVVSSRGACGGYRLASPPEAITMGRLLRAVEDNLEIVDCLHGHCASNRETCVSRNLWAKLYQQINAYLDTVTLKQLLDDEI